MVERVGGGVRGIAYGPNPGSGTQAAKGREGCRQRKRKGRQGRKEGPQSLTGLLSHREHRGGRREHREPVGMGLQAHPRCRWGRSQRRGLKTPPYTLLERVELTEDRERR